MQSNIYEQNVPRFELKVGLLVVVVVVVVIIIIII